jgi:uncharacterized cupredoxin-like copper-binding protein
VVAGACSEDELARNQALVVAAFAAIACSAGALAASEALGGYVKDERAISVSLRTFRIEPQVLHLKSGRPIVLRVLNDSGIAHDLTAPEFFARADMSPPDRAKVLNGRIALGPNQSAAVTIIPKSGRYPVKCSHPLHKIFGMTGTIVVDP